MPLLLLVILIFFVTVGAIVGGYVMFAGQGGSKARRSIEDRLQQLGGGVDALDESAQSLIRTHERGPLPAIDQLAKKVNQGQAMTQWVEQSGLKLTFSGVFVISLVLAVVFAMIGLVIESRWWGPMAGLALGFVAPWAYVKHRRSKRLHKFEEHFPEALDLLARAIRAGHAFGAGMKMVADEMHEPVGPEFKKAFEEQNFGLSLKESLDNLALRVPILDVRFFGTAVLIQRETGGNLAEILDNLANVVRERFKILRQVRVHTAHGRFTGYVLLALPAFLAVALHFINPEHMQMLFDDKIGQGMMIACVVMQTLGWIWIKQVVKIEV